MHVNVAFSCCNNSHQKCLNFTYGVAQKSFLLLYTLFLLSVHTTKLKLGYVNFCHPVVIEFSREKWPFTKKCWLKQDYFVFDSHEKNSQGYFSIYRILVVWIFLKKFKTRKRKWNLIFFALVSAKKISIETILLNVSKKEDFNLNLLTKSQTYHFESADEY